MRKTNSMETKNGIIHVFATGLIAYAVANLNDKIWVSLVVGLVGIALYLLKGWLNSRGITVGKKD